MMNRLPLAGVRVVGQYTAGVNRDRPSAGGKRRLG